MNDNLPIIGYIHVCQKSGWQRAFDTLMAQIKASELYDTTREIRCCVVNDSGGVIDDERFHDAKIQILFKGESNLYERPTLIDMRQSTSHEQCVYWYMHTKGIAHYGTSIEANVADWIELLLYWNASRWRDAIAAMRSNEFDVYGCNYQFAPQPHFSGNFWWARSHYIHSLSDTINAQYYSPEFWLCSKNPRVYNTLHSGVFHYSARYNLGEIQSLASVQHWLWSRKSEPVLFLYGAQERCVDVTSVAKKAFQRSSDTAYHIDARNCFNKLFGDVLPNTQKLLYVGYSSMIVTMPEIRTCDYEIAATANDGLALINKSAASEPMAISCGEMTLALQNSCSSNSYEISKDLRGGLVVRQINK